jgi:hypothetical protein
MKEGFGKKLSNSLHKSIPEGVAKMNNHQRQLITDSDFERMRVFSQLIAVYQDGELLDGNNRIVSHDEHKVLMDNEMHYLKSTCQFYRL